MLCVKIYYDTNSTWIQEHRFEFDEAPSVEAVASHLSGLTLKFHGYDKDGKPGSTSREEEEDGCAMARPVGVALLIAGVDRGNRPVLCHLDPSGETSFVRRLHVTGFANAVRRFHPN